ncbi:elongation factor G [Oxobacter pfennigii]|uniref:Elongation factor G n=1 Tax=Oxobacter pfennigii TaxID=36849 RepID=A0A0P8W4J3_9CLOT|nr:elongation factor G [Oxobacter pfennigii]KPU42673.1 elongation factor G [Oxobacter pfennigii]
MKDYQTQQLRNICLIGHGSTGKTSLAEVILYNCKETDRIGRVEDGTTTMDYDAEEKKRQISISAAMAPCEWKNSKINIVDTPGYFDFVGEVMEGLRAVDAALITLCAVSGVQVGTEKMWDYCKESKLPRAFFVNKLDRENSSFDKVLTQMRDKFGTSVVPLQIPIGKEASFKGIVDVIKMKAKIFEGKNVKEDDVPADLTDTVNEYRASITEAVAENDEVLLDKYLSEGELSDEELITGLRTGIAKGDIAPVFCGSSLSNIGISTLLDAIVDYMPSPLDVESETGTNPKNEKQEQRPVKSDAPFSAFVFKTIADPYVGKLSLFRVVSGTIASDSTVYNANQDKSEKVGTLYILKGKTQTAVSKLSAGDVGAVAKLAVTTTGDTLCDAQNPIKYKAIDFPQPCISMSVKPKSKGDEDKISSGLTKLLEEDPTFKVSRDVENAETIISGTGELHLEVIARKLQNKFGAEVALDLPKIPYRETIRKISDVQGKHKKQSGGHGQYGDVHIKFEPNSDGTDFMFVDQIVGGVVPRQYIPAVEKGLKECISKGVLAGYPVVGLKATLHFGSYHPVDSSEMAFKVAASLAYKKGMKDAEPILLEPIMHVEVTVPDEYMGDIIGDLNKKRGRVLGMEPNNGQQVIIAEVPQAEIFKYATDLRSMTQARGSFTMKFERYEEVPANISAKIVEEAAKTAVAEEE